MYTNTYLSKRQIRKKKADTKRDVYALIILTFMDEYVKTTGSQKGLSRELNIHLSKLLKSKPEDAHLIRQSARSLNKQLTDTV